MFLQSKKEKNSWKTLREIIEVLRERAKKWEKKAKTREKSIKWENEGTIYEKGDWKLKRLKWKVLKFHEILKKSMKNAINHAAPPFFVQISLILINFLQFHLPSVTFLFEKSQ